MSVCEDGRVVTLIDVVEDLLAHIVKDELVVNRRAAITVISAPVASVEGKVFGFVLGAVNPVGLVQGHLLI